MGFATNDIIEVTWEQRMFSQVMLNIQHYVVQSSSSTGSDIGDSQSFADYLSTRTMPGMLIPVWQAAMTAEWKLDQVRVQKIAPTRAAYVTAQIDKNGLSGDDGQLTNIAVVVSKRGSSGTRRGQGSVHFGGWPTTVFNQGEIQAGPETWWNAFEPLYTAVQNVATIPATFKPVIYNPGATPNWQNIAVWQLQSTARVMRRRTVRVGV